MINSSSFIFLYTILGGIVYVHYPTGISYSVICFDNKTYISSPHSCHYMKVKKINNDINSFFYEMDKQDINSNLFKIFYYFPNNTLIETNWVSKNSTYSSKKNEKLQICNNTLKDFVPFTSSAHNFTINVARDKTNIFNYIILFLNISTLLLILILLYKYFS